jgi:uncharacterized phage infection (PIP) family protein YhgE
LLFIATAASSHGLTPLTALELFAGFLALVGLLGGAGWVVFRSTVAKTSVDNYKEAYESMEASNSGLEARVKTLEADVKDAKAHAERCDAELAGQRTAYNALAEQVRGSAAIEQLGKQIDTQFGQLIAIIRETSEGNASALDSMGEALGRFLSDLRTHFDMQHLDRRQVSDERPHGP